METLSIPFNMFAKPYKLKSNNTLKNSEKKHLGQRIQNEFPAATEEKVKELVPVKSSTSCMKLILHSEETVGVYVVDGVPIMIDLGETLAPTVCALWKVPDLIPTISIHSPVLSKMQGGAPLYAPGVVTDTSLPQFRKGSVIAACTTDNAAAGVVGLAAMSSADLLRTSMGVCLETLHVFGDLLCKEIKFNKIERPKLGPPSHDVVQIMTNDISQLNIQPVKEEWPSLVKEQPAPVVNEPKVITETETQESEATTDAEMEDLNNTVNSETSETDSVPEDMDGLLRWCLLSFLKLEGKNIELPLKTNLLYKNHLMPHCPPDRVVDVKKSTYKKMGKFLEAMEREGLIQVREVEKGVSALVGATPAHPAVRAHRPAPPAPPARAAPAPGDDYAPPQIRELYCVTANVLDFFAPLKKGTALSASEVRGAVARHAATHALGDGRHLRLDAALAAALGRQPGEVVKREEASDGVLARMTPATELRFAGGDTRLLRARLLPVSMHVVTRSGNKKVTLVSNLESYGFALGPLARACQLRAGAACGVTRAPGARADQLMLQGDQTHFMAKLLIEKFGLPKKFVDGADKALNKKKMELEEDSLKQRK